MNDTPQTAVEFAAGRGHPDYPLLSATDWPSSGIPCADFSPWLRERIADHDDAAIASYMRGIMGGGREFVIQLRAEWDEREGPKWVEERSFEEVDPAEMDEKLASIKLAEETEELLTGMSGDALLDLRTAVFILGCLGDDNKFALVKPEEGRPYLAAVMAPHAVGLVDPERAAERTRSMIDKMRRELGGPSAWDEIEAPTPEQLVLPPVDSPAAAVVAQLPLGSRAHLANLGRRKTLDRPAAASKFDAFYDTRRRGYDRSEGLKILSSYGLLRRVTDSTVIRVVVPMELSKAELQEKLDLSDISYPKSANKTRLIALLEAGAPEEIDRIVADEQAYELTSSGLAAARWLTERVDATSQFWGVYLALRAR